MSARGVSRRTMLAGAAATGVALVAGGVGLTVASGGLPGTMRAMLERMLGPFAMHDEEFARFANDFIAARPVPEGTRALLLGAGERIGAIALLDGGDSATAEKVRGFERTLLADFTLATGLTGPPDGSELAYGGLFGASGCGNPYARFDLDPARSG